jgi:general secretion pathway protein G
MHAAIRHADRNAMHARRQARGFTLIEILVVLVIIGILAAMIAPNIIGRDDQARVTAAKSDLQAIGQALDLYKMDNFRYPGTDQGLDALVNKPADAKNWPASGYLKVAPKDPWGNDYVYVAPGSKGPYDLLSYGADGKEGGEGYDADINVLDR